MIAGLRRWLGRAAPPPPEAAVESRIATYRDLIAWRRDRDDAALAGAESVQRAALASTSAKTLRACCDLCRRNVDFPMPWAGTNAAPDLREALVCPSCHLNARARAALGLLREAQPRPDADVYLTEQASPAFVWLRKAYPRARGSEFTMAPARKQAVENWLHKQGVPGSIAHEDVTALSFADASLDGIGSFDVLEHVPDYRRALAEFARVLRPGGDLVLTAPFNCEAQDTLVRARVDNDGNIEHLLPPEIHGDPLSDGVLSFYTFGWDVLDAARAAGFADAAWRRTWSPEQALFGMWTMHARRAAP